MNMKKLVAFFTVLVVLTAAMAMVLTGCGQKEPQTEVVDPTTQQEQTDAPEPPDATEDTQTPTQAATEPEEVAPTEDEKPEETTQPTESAEPATEPKDDPASTEPGSTQQPTTGGNTGGNTQTPTPAVSDYEAYIAMTGEQQQAFIDQFDSVGDFVKWYNEEKAKYEAEHPDIEIGEDTIIDGSQLKK